MKIFYLVLKRKFIYISSNNFVEKTLNIFSFMIELIKSKQDDVITKKLIRLRRLDQSMLRFTRIYRDQYGQFHRDIDGQEYSCIMTESKKEEFHWKFIILLNRLW